MAWRFAGIVAAFAAALMAVLTALGFAAAGFYMALAGTLRLSPVIAVFGTAFGLLVIAAIAAMCLRRGLFGQRGAPRRAAAGDARRAAAGLEAEAAAAIAARPAASLLACGIAGLLVGTLRRPPRA